jgi:hypothetical protein
MALEVERRIDRGEPALTTSSRTFVDLVRLDRDDLKEGWQAHLAIQDREPCLSRSTPRPPRSARYRLAGLPRHP